MQKVQEHPQHHKKKLLDQTRDILRIMEYAKRTEETYIQWIRRFILFHNKRHPREMGASEVKAFLTHLAVNDHVAASTQNQALHAILFLYKKVLGIELQGINAHRAKRPETLPVVFSRREVKAILAHLQGLHCRPRWERRQRPGHNAAEDS